MSGNVRIKICGITSPEDAIAAVEAGADLIGINFVPTSKRCVDIPTAAAICETIADVPVGAFLSGGVDSVALVGLLSETHPDPIRTVSFK